LAVLYDRGSAIAPVTSVGGCHGPEFHLGLSRQFLTIHRGRAKACDRREIRIAHLRESILVGHSSDPNNFIAAFDFIEALLAVNPEINCALGALPG
jgi:hypothetical protein